LAGVAALALARFPGPAALATFALVVARAPFAALALAICARWLRVSGLPRPGRLATGAPSPRAVGSPSPALGHSGASMQFSQSGFFA
jgi:hypothetical protein